MPDAAHKNIVVMDNLRAHKVAGIEDALMGCGARLIYLPPYAPDLSPIALCWSQRKTCLHQIGVRTSEAREEALTHAMEGITAVEAWAWFAHDSYVGT